MSEKKALQIKMCIFCQYWNGDRQIGHFRDTVLFEDIRDRGECTRNRMSKSGDMTCHHFERWSLLKK